MGMASKTEIAIGDFNYTRDFGVSDFFQNIPAHD
jgi:hypothetical protein